MRQNRLEAEERKRSIRHSAVQVFLEKGFKDATMEDVMNAEGISKGGLYYHYKSKEDLFYDIMKDGVDFRIDLVKSYIDNNKSMNREDLILNMLMDKLLDYNEFKSIYVMFILELKNNKKFKELYEVMQEAMKHEFIEFCNELGLVEYISLSNAPFTFFMNAIFMGVEMLSFESRNEENEKMLRVMIKAYMDSLKQ